MYFNIKFAYYNLNFSFFKKIDTIPQAHPRPYPREPVATSTKGNKGVGCPSRSLVNFLKFFNSST